MTIYFNFCCEMTSFLKCCGSFEIITDIFMELRCEIITSLVDLMSSNYQNIIPGTVSEFPSCFGINLIKEETENLIETRATLSYCGVNPAYIFVILDVVNTKMVAIPHEMALTSKFFVIHRHPSVKRDARAALKLCAVCFPCSAPYQVLDCKSGGDFSSLDELWNDHNSNLRGWKIGSDIFSVSFDPKREACNAIKSGNKIFAGYITCAQLALQGIHNFSNIIISEKRVLSSLLNPTFYVSYGRFIPCNLIDVLLLTPAVRPRIWLPYCERKFQITGTTVSYQKARFGGLRGLIFAFDAYTWEASGVSFFLISILLAVIGGWRDGDTKLNVFFPIFANRGNGCCFPSVANIMVLVES